MDIRDIQDLPIKEFLDEFGKIISAHIIKEHSLKRIKSEPKNLESLKDLGSLKIDSLQYEYPSGMFLDT